MQRNDLDSGAALSMFLGTSVPARPPVGYKKELIGVILLQICKFRIM